MSEKSNRQYATDQSRRANRLLRRRLWPTSVRRFYAWWCHYFWMPCPVCGEYFGGNEWLGLLSREGGATCVSCELRNGGARMLRHGLNGHLVVTSPPPGPGQFSRVICMTCEPDERVPYLESLGVELVHEKETDDGRRA